MRTRAVNVSREDYDVYIGRGSDPNTGHKLTSRRWGNPYPVSSYGSAKCMRLYFAHLAANPWLIEQARTELKGKRLGCWCKPGPCHGDVLAALAEGASLDEVRADWADTLATTRGLFGEE